MSAQSTLPTCYRHPDRQTRLACSNCERPVCVDCVRSASVGQKCLECSQAPANSRAVDGAAAFRAAAPPVVSYGILTICLAIAAVRVLLPPLGNALAVAGVQINQLVAAGEWWRLLTAAFFHAGLAHLAFNMWALYVFGPQLERQVGSLAFAALYLASAVAGGTAFYVLEPTGSAVGASGAIFGLFGAWLAASYHGRGTPAGDATLRQLLVLLGINLVFGFLPGTNIAWQAHLGGLVAGFAVALAWTAAVFRSRASLRAVPPVAVAGVAFALLFSV